MRFPGAALVLLAAACDNGVSCNTVTDDLGDLCVPSMVAVGIPSVFDVRELCGAGCTGAPTCTALFRNGQVLLDVEQEVCSDTQNATCADMGCQQRVLRCVIPALGIGDYPLVVPGGPSRLLRVQQGGVASCRFALDGGVQ